MSDNLDKLVSARFVNVDKLAQKYMKHLKWLENRLRASRPKEGIPDKEWIDTFTKVTKLVIDLQKEHRVAQASAASKMKDMSVTDLVDKLKPALIKLGWSPPKENT